jgi:hypothetical protein
VAPGTALPSPMIPTRIGDMEDILVDVKVVEVR